MRGALPIFCVHCMLLASTVRATAADPGSAATAGVPAASATVSTPAASSPAPGPFDPADLLFAAPTTFDRIGRIVAPVMVNGRGPFRFIVDTGANHSTISPQLANALGLERETDSTILVNGITGTAPVPAVMIRRLQAGDLVMEQTQLPVIWAPLMAGADGILGTAQFTNETLFVDFLANRVVISRSGWITSPAGFSRIPAKRLAGGLLSVFARIGGVSARAIIDTGSERTLGNLALHDALYSGRRADLHAVLTVVYGATSEIAQGEIRAAPTIELADAKIAGVTVVYGDFHIFDVWGLASRPALIIGMDILGAVRGLGIDFRDSELYLDSGFHPS